MKSISLVIPATTEDARFLPELLRSIRSMHSRPDEIIISVSRGTQLDGATLQAIEQELAHCERGRIILNSNKLLAAANRNMGASTAQGDIVSFFDADDLMHPQYFEVLRHLFEDGQVMHLNHSITQEAFPAMQIRGIQVVGPEVLRAAYFPNDQYRECTGITRAYGGLLSFPVAAGHAVVARQVLEKVRWRDPSEQVLGVAEDYEFCMEVLHTFQRSVVIDAVLSIYRPSQLRRLNDASANETGQHLTMLAR